MKYLLLLASMLPIICTAQDKINVVDGSERQGYITSEFGRYVRYTSPNGDRMALDKDLIASINYSEKGLIEMKKRDVDPANLGRNIVSYNYFALVHQNIGFTYERIFKSGHTSIKIPLQFSLGTPNFYNFHPTFASGIDFNVYPTGQGRLKYFLGPGIRFGEVSRSNNFYAYYYDDIYYSQNPPIQDETLSSSFAAFMFKNGVSYQPIEQMNVSVLAGLGVRNFEEDFVNNGFSQSFFWFEATVGYRF